LEVNDRQFLFNKNTLVPSYKNIKKSGTPFFVGWKKQHAAWQPTKKNVLFMNNCV